MYTDPLGAEPGRLRPYVVATGSIAAGASTLAARLIDRLGWQGHLEGHVENDNAFFEDANRDFTRWGFHNQVHFLLASVHRHDRLAAVLADGASDAPAVIEDRTPFEHTGAYLAAYARLGRLDNRETQLLQELTAVLERSYLVPDLLIYRQLATEDLQKRIAQRGRRGETQDPDLLTALRDSFDAFAAAWDRSAKIIVPADADVLDDSVLDGLIAEITAVLR